MADWNALQAEYVTTDASLYKLAKKFGIGHSTVYTHAKKEGWAQLRQDHRDSALDAVPEAVRDPRTQACRRLGSVAGKLLGKIEVYVDSLSPDLCDPRDFKQVSATLKDVRDVLMLQSELDDQEQQARIEKLRQQAKQETLEQTVLRVEGLPEEFKA